MTLIDLILEERKILSNNILPESETSENWQKIVDKIKLLINAGANVNTKDEHFGYTALMLSYTAQTTQLLINAGAEVNVRDKNGETALLWASAQGATDRVKLLINAGADINAMDDVFGNTSLMRARTPEVAQLLIDAGTDVNLFAKYGWTALEQSVGFGQYEKIKILLAAGANINAKNTLDGKTALMEASGVGQAEIVKLLINAGANVNDKDKEGHNAIWYAQNHADKRVCHFGIQPAKEEEYSKIIELLKKSGAQEK